MIVSGKLSQCFHDGFGGFAAGPHGEDDGGGAADGIASGEDELAACLSVFVGFDATPALAFQARCAGADEGVGASAEGGDDGVGLDVAFAALDG